MALSFKAFTDFVSDMIARWESDTGIQAVLVSGDPLLAAFDSGATEFIFIENLLQQVSLMARLSTSTGPDVDSFLADFGLSRLPAIAAQGQVTFTTASPATAQIVIPVGTVVQTLGGAIQFQVIADPSQSAWSPTLGAYVINQGQSIAIATVQALVAGSVNNVQVGQLVQMASPIGGIATVTNNAPIVNGQNPETDSAAKARFVLFFAQLSKATEAAILFACASVQQNLDIVLLDNQIPFEFSTRAQPGFFTVVIDDGSGSPPGTLITAITAAVAAIRAFTIGFSVSPPLTGFGTIILVPIRSPNVSSSIAIVEPALVNFVNSLGIGQGLTLAKVIQIVQEADPTITDVDISGILINGVNEDLVIGVNAEIRTNAEAVTVEGY